MITRDFQLCDAKLKCNSRNNCEIHVQFQTLIKSCQTLRAYFITQRCYFSPNDAFVVRNKKCYMFAFLYELIYANGYFSLPISADQKKKSKNIKKNCCSFFDSDPYFPLICKLLNINPVKLRFLCNHDYFQVILIIFLFS